MAEPALFQPGPGQGGIARHLIHDDRIDHGRWLRACAEGSFVGECRTCGGYLRPLTPDEVTRGRFDYEAECTACRKPINAPDGRVLRRSSAHREMPAGWFEHRNRALRKSGEAG